MAEEKILKDEILKDEQLEQVAGGSTKELTELYKAACNSPGFIKATNLNTNLTDIYDIETEMQTALDNIGIFAETSPGKDVFGYKNAYYQGGAEDFANKISHADMVKMIKNYGKNS